MVAKLLRVLESPYCSWSMSATLCYYTRLYGAQLVLITLLSAVTVYRREMSCNHVYTSPEEEEEKNKRISSSREWDEESTEELLEGAGAYCSGEPLLAVALSLWPKRTLTTPEERVVSLPRRKSSAIITCGLPPDVQVHLLSYLHPKDVASFGCTSSKCRKITDNGETSSALWKTLWFRDYAWIVHSWDVGRSALQRSQPTPRHAFTKDFYFLFGQCYLNYILAGKNNDEECFIGLHGHVYDITDFLHTHPGSPDTLKVQAGKDATRYFEDMNHSSAARRLTKSLCVVVDTSCFSNECGLFPTTNTTITDDDDVPTTVEAPTVPMARTRRPRHPATLESIRRKYLQQEQDAIARATQRLSQNVLSHVNVYYDPFQLQWKAWYVNRQFETVFVDQL